MSGFISDYPFETTVSDESYIESCVYYNIFDSHVKNLIDNTDYIPSFFKYLEEKGLLFSNKVYKYMQFTKQYQYEYISGETWLNIDSSIAKISFRDKAPGIISFFMDSVTDSYFVERYNVFFYTETGTTIDSVQTEFDKRNPIEPVEQVLSKSWFSPDTFSVNFWIKLHTSPTCITPDDINTFLSRFMGCTHYVYGYMYTKVSKTFRVPPKDITYLLYRYTDPMFYKDSGYYLYYVLGKIRINSPLYDEDLSLIAHLDFYTKLNCLFCILQTKYNATRLRHIIEFLELDSDYDEGKIDFEFFLDYNVKLVDGADCISFERTGMSIYLDPVKNSETVKQYMESLFLNVK